MVKGEVSNMDAKLNEMTGRVHSMAPSPNRGKLRSVTYKGIAEAMAKQWG
jgi:hypothetical protein